MVSSAVLLVEPDITDVTIGKKTLRLKDVAADRFKKFKFEVVSDKEADFFFKWGIPICKKVLEGVNQSILLCGEPYDMIDPAQKSGILFHILTQVFECLPSENVSNLSIECCEIFDRDHTVDLLHPHAPTTIRTPILDKEHCFLTLLEALSNHFTSHLSFTLYIEQEIDSETILKSELSIITLGIISNDLDLRLRKYLETWDDSVLNSNLLFRTVWERLTGNWETSVCVTCSLKEDMRQTAIECFEFARRCCLCKTKPIRNCEYRPEYLLKKLEQLHKSYEEKQFENATDETLKESLLDYRKKMDERDTRISELEKEMKSMSRRLLAHRILKERLVDAENKVKLLDKNGNQNREDIKRLIRQNDEYRLRIKELEFELEHKSNLVKLHATDEMRARKNNECLREELNKLTKTLWRFTKNAKDMNGVDLVEPFGRRLTRFEESQKAILSKNNELENILRRSEVNLDEAIMMRFELEDQLEDLELKHQSSVKSLSALKDDLEQETSKREKAERELDSLRGTFGNFVKNVSKHRQKAIREVLVQKLMEPNTLSTAFTPIITINATAVKTYPSLLVDGTPSFSSESKRFPMASPSQSVAKLEQVVHKISLSRTLHKGVGNKYYTSTLEIGDQIRLVDNRKGNVRWYGPLDGSVKAGIVITYGCGDCNGTYAGKRLFHCEEGKGTFVELSKITHIMIMQPNDKLVKVRFAPPEAGSPRTFDPFGHAPSPSPRGVDPARTPLRAKRSVGSFHFPAASSPHTVDSEFQEATTPTFATRHQYVRKRTSMGGSSTGSGSIMLGSPMTLAGPKNIDGDVLETGVRRSVCVDDYVSESVGGPTFFDEIASRCSVSAESRSSLPDNSEVLQAELNIVE